MKFVWLAALPLVIATTFASPTPADTPTTVGGMQPVLSTVPRMEPRPGDSESMPWGIAPPTEPTTSFIDSLKGNDAAVEVIVGQGRLLTLKQDLGDERGTAVVAVGDPTILEFEIMPNPRMIRLTGLRAGVTDLSVTTSGGETYSFEVHVVFDLTLLRAQLTQVFPSALLRLAQMREHVVVEGQARSAEQVNRILQFMDAYLGSVQVSQQVRGDSKVPNDPRARTPVQAAPDAGDDPDTDDPNSDGDGLPEDLPQAAGDEVGGNTRTKVKFNKPQIINLIRVPGIHQVLLQVRIAELNRTAQREIGSDLGFAWGDGNVIGTQIGGAAVSTLSILGFGDGVSGGATAGSSATTTAFGIFPNSDFEFILRALRENGVARILAEPNVIALSGHKANFLAGGEFPVPQNTGFGAVTTTWKEFGVRLDFLPYVLDDETVRLAVVPEVSNVDFALGAVLVQGGTTTPGLNTRRAATTVELKQGQTLAIAGLLQLEIAGNTGRIPGLGDVPYLGPFFSNTSHKSVEKELLVLVTPHLVQPMDEEQTPPLPGETIMEPNDCEFYLLNRIEGRTGRPHRSTVEYDPIMKHHLMKYEQTCIQGPCGYSQ